MRKSCIAIAFLLAAGFVSASDYHVAKSGNDANKGSAAKPFLTIQRAADVAQPGDVITVHECPVPGPFEQISKGSNRLTLPGLTTKPVPAENSVLVY